MLILFGQINVTMLSRIWKKFVSTALVLRGPNWDFPFQISYDASDITIGAVLGKEEDKKPYEIYYINKNLSPA